MKRWLWLLAVPWIVWDSTYTFNCKPIDGTPYFSCPTEHMYYLSYKGNPYSTMDLHFVDKEQAADMADALNQAHLKRRFASKCVKNRSPNVQEELCDGDDCYKCP